MRLWATGLFMLGGAAVGVFLASDSTLLAAAMGAVIGLIASLMVRTYPRDHDYAHNGDFWSKD